MNEFNRRSPLHLLVLVALTSACANSVTGAMGDAAPPVDDRGSTPLDAPTPVEDRSATPLDAPTLDASAPDVTPSIDAPTLDASIAPDRTAPILDVAAVLEAGRSDGPIDVPPGPTTCARARPLTPGIEESGSAFEATERLPPSSGTAPQGGPVRWFSFTPVDETRYQIIVRATSDPSLGRPLVRLCACPPSISCLPEVANPRGLSTVQFRQYSRAGVPVHIAVGSDQADVFAPPRTFTYEIKVRLLTVAPPNNGECLSYAEVRDGTNLLDQSLEDAVEPASGCDGAAAAPALFYGATVGAGETLRVQAINGAGVPTTHPSVPALFLSAGCAATTCLATGTTTSVPGQAQLEWRNTATASRTVVLAVETASPRTTPFRFDLAVQVGAAP